LTSAALLLVVSLAPAPGDSDTLADSRKTFLAARTAIADGRYQDALTLYRKALDVVPNDPIVHLEYAQLLRDLNVVDEATKQAREAVRLDPNLAEAHRLLGSLELTAAEKDPASLPAAIEELSAAHRLAPTDTGTSVALARALLASDRAAEAAAILDDLPELGGQPSIMRLTAEAKSKSGRYQEAEEIYRELWEADPADREIAAALIDVYEDEDKLDEALDVLETLAAKDRDNPAVGERIVLDLARAGRFPESEQKARDLVAKRPENRAAQRLLATVLFERGSTAEGEKILRALLETDPDDPVTRRALASELVRERRFDEARAMYEDIIRRAGNDPRQADNKAAAQVELGFIAYLQRDYAGARKILAPVAISGGQVQDRAARILLACERDSDDFAAGRASAAQFAAAKPADPEWTAEEAEFRWHLGEKKEAEAALDALGSSGQLEKMMAAADSYGRLKLYEPAVRISREAVKKYPESTEALFRFASSLERGGNPAEAEKVFLQLLALRPNDAATLNYLGYMWADQGVQLERAKEMLEKAVAREPRNAAYLDSLGWAYFRLGRMPEAEKNLREAYRREPSDPTIEEHIGDLEAREGNVEGAIRHWEKALDLKHEEPDRVRDKLRRAGAPVSQR
jgi:tetratricopeptide (TPR) repeat protein